MWAHKVLVLVWKLGHFQAYQRWVSWERLQIVCFANCGTLRDVFSLCSQHALQYKRQLVCWQAKGPLMLTSSQSGAPARQALKLIPADAWLRCSVSGLCCTADDPQRYAWRGGHASACEPAACIHGSCLLLFALQAGHFLLLPHGSACYIAPLSANECSPGALSHP